MKYEHFVPHPEFAADLIPRAFRRARFEKIVDNFHGTVKAKHALRLLFQKLGYSRDRIRTSQRVMNGRSVTGIATEQRAVRAVQRGNDARLLLGWQHGAREDGRRGMWHGVMD